MSINASIIWSRVIGDSSSHSPARERFRVIALGHNAHIFARPYRRDELRSCFEEVLGTQVASFDHVGIAEPLLVVRFPGGGSLSMEFTEDAPDSDEPRLGAWLELRCQDPDGLFETVRNAGLTAVRHPGHPYYFMTPGGQVFAIASES
jgi:hypothetical protein